MNPNHITRNHYAIGLILYHPEESLLRRIDQMINLGFCVYVFDNSPFDSRFARNIQENQNIYYLTAGKNVGLGVSLSTLCATAYIHGYQRLLFLDQDTGISTQTLEFIETFTQTLSTSIQQQYAALVFDGRPAADHSVQEVRLAISSGSLFNLTALQQIGWHNENYFVDCVDYENFALGRGVAALRSVLLKTLLILITSPNNPTKRLASSGNKYSSDAIQSSESEMR
jgi:rhamnosyltransferase